jgi:ABC-2 type transport system ATP-binding protein
MRVVLGLDASTAGEARVNGCRYTELRAPLRQVGAMLDGRGVHGGRTARFRVEPLSSTFGRLRLMGDAGQWRAVRPSAT